MKERTSIDINKRKGSLNNRIVGIQTKNAPQSAKRKVAGSGYDEVITMSKIKDDFRTMTSIKEPQFELT